MLYIILLFSISISQNFSYKSDDWFTISNPGAINSITSTHDEIYFCTDNGIYIYNLSTKSFAFEEDYLRTFHSSESMMIHYDEYRDYLWYLNKDDLNYKPRISSFWRQIDFYELDVNSYRSIKNIGSNHFNVYLDLGHSIIALDPITGKYQEELNENDFNQINWSSSNYNTYYDNFDLSNYYSFEGFNIISNNEIENNGRLIYITTIFKDRRNDYWIGTSSGEIFFCDSKMKSMKKIDSIPLISNINISYFDDYEEWWMSTNDNILINDRMHISENPIFISKWIELENKWINYTKTQYSNIESKDITSFCRIENWLYIGTNKGLLIFDINQNKWSLIDKTNGLHSNVIYDLIYFNNNIYIATELGINILTTFGNILIYQEVFNSFNNFTIYDLNIVNDNFFLATDIGVYQYSYKENIINKIISDKYINIFVDNQNNFILSRRNKLYKLNNRRELILSTDQIKNLSFCNDYVWVNNINKAIIINLKNNKILEYNQNDGIVGDIINHIDCDDSWVWFSTNKGISMYNWNKYHNNEK